MENRENNYAFIDSQNLNLNIRNQGWILDFARFRVYLKEKYMTTKAFLFVGYVEDNKNKFRVFRPHLRFMNDLRSRLSYKKEKAP